MAPQLIVTKQWTTSATQPLTEANLDAMKSSIETFFNTTGLDNTNIQDGGISAGNLASTSVTTEKLADAAVGTSAINDAAVTQAKRADLGQQLSATTSTQWSVTNPSVSITTTGRPLFIGLQPDSSETDISQIFLNDRTLLLGNTTLYSSYTLKRDSTTIAQFQITHVVSGSYSEGSYPGFGGSLPSCLSTIDIPSAGTYTYSAVGPAGHYLKLLAYEL